MTYAEIEAFTLKDEGVLEAYEQIEMQCLVYGIEEELLIGEIHDIQSKQNLIRKAKDELRKVMNTSKKIRHEIMLKEMNNG